MAALEGLLGAGLLAKSGPVATADALNGKKAVALYFSAHWCPPCRGFTPKFAEWYTANLKDKGLEVVFVSSDKEEDAFNSYFGEMPWLALPYAARDVKAQLSKRYKVSGIPSLVIIDENGKTITTDGRSAVSADPTGEDFPWIPKTAGELFAAAKIVGKDGNQVSIAEALQDKKALALYFSAHWCPPCRGFTPQLAEWYKANLQAKGLEVIFVSSDRDEAAFKEYWGEMPWLALDFSDRKMKEQLSACYKVQGIPSLVILDPSLKTVTTEGRAAVASDPEGSEMPWYPKPVSNFSKGPGNINEVPTVVVFCETQTAEEQNALQVELTPLAQKYLDKADGEDPDFAFVMSTQSEGLGSRVRSMLGLPDCGKPAEPMAPQLALIDIPSDGAFYLAPKDTAINAATVEKFLADFAKGSLERKQLS